MDCRNSRLKRIFTEIRALTRWKLVVLVLVLLFLGVVAVPGVTDVDDGLVKLALDGPAPEAQPVSVPHLMVAAVVELANDLAGTSMDIAEPARVQLRKLTAAANGEEYVITSFDTRSTFRADTYYTVLFSRTYRSNSSVGTARTTPELEDMLQEIPPADGKRYTADVLSSRTKRLLVNYSFIHYDDKLYNVTLKEPGDLTSLRFNASVLDDTATAYDPAVIQLQLYNPKNTTVMVSSGVFWPFELVNMHGDTNFFLWSDSYTGQQTPKISSPLDLEELSILPLSLQVAPIEPGKRVVRNYTVTPILKDVAPGNYTTSGEIGYSGKERFGQSNTLNWTISLELS